MFGLMNWAAIAMATAIALLTPVENAEANSAVEIAKEYAASIEELARGGSSKSGHWQGLCRLLNDKLAIGYAKFRTIDQFAAWGSPKWNRGSGIQQDPYGIKMTDAAYVGYFAAYIINQGPIDELRQHLSSLNPVVSAMPNRNIRSPERITVQVARVVMRPGGDPTDLLVYDGKIVDIEGAAMGGMHSATTNAGNNLTHSNDRDTTDQDKENEALTSMARTARYVSGSNGICP